MKISFADFWDGFDYNNNFFRDLILSIDNSYNFIPFSNDTDILIYSCFISIENFKRKFSFKIKFKIKPFLI